MKVKVGDKVLVIAGKDKGKEGKILRTLKKDQKVVVEGINIVKKHSKPTNTNDQGGIFDIEAPIHVSNVKLVDAKEETKKVTKKAASKKVEKEEVKAEPKKKTTAKKTTSKKASK